MNEKSEQAEREAEFDALIDAYQSAQKHGSLDDRAMARGMLKAAYRAALSPHQMVADSAQAEPVESHYRYRHRWDSSGERCVKCGAKDWMGGDCSISDDFI